jgi:hypothetical protein
MRLSQEQKIASNLRARVREALKWSGNNKSAGFYELVNCDVSTLKAHIEQQWQKGMSWDNWSMSGWHIDHIRPCSTFNLSDVEQQKECFNYRNLQPLWAIDNLRKGSKLVR